MDRLRVEDERQRRLLTRALPLAVIALVAFVVGVSAGAGGSPAQESAQRFVDAWVDGDFKRMHEELSSASREAISMEQMRAAFAQGRDTATIVSLEREGDAEEVGESADGTLVDVPMKVATIAFGEIEQPLHLTYGADGIAWTKNIVFPGLKRLERLSRATTMPPRAAILADDGQALAQGPSLTREHPLGDSSIDVTGYVDVPPKEMEAEMRRLGYPPGEPVGISGLELAFNERLAGTPGGELRAVSKGNPEGRLLGRGEPQKGLPVRTTIDPTLQETTVAAISPWNGGAAVLDAQTGEVKALGGQAFSALQPPGSTFKIITATAALEKKLTTLDTEYPVVDGANAGGRYIYNAHEELCGGTFSNSFAHSCNSVFAPLGVEITGEYLTDTAERFGFNSVPSLYNAAATAAVDPPTPTMPTEYESPVDVGVSAIGQGTVQATALQVATMAQTIAKGGLRMPTPIVKDPLLKSDAKPVRATSKQIAGQVADMMVGVVAGGTGSAGAIPEAQVAGKTGTSEVGPSGETDEDGDPINIEDAWFSAFAPADKPRLAVGVMVIDSPGDGGTIAAPIAAQIFSAGL